MIQIEQKMQLAKQQETPLKSEPKTTRFKVLDSLSNHWQGLSVFVEIPQVSMGNNPAEKALRMPVTGRRRVQYGAQNLHQF